MKRPSLAGVEIVPLANLPALQIHYKSEGEGPPLLLISGTGFPGATWRTGVAMRFVERGFQTITYDHRGVGASDKPDASYSTRMFAADAVGLLDALGIERSHIVGHSMGGRIAQWIALDHPERVSSLVLAASGPGEFDPNFKVMRGIPLHTAVALIEKGYEGYVREHIAGPFFFTPQFARKHPDVASRLVEAFWEDRPPLKSYLRHVIARQQHQTAEHLGKIDAPTLVIVGDDDQMKAGTGNHLKQSQYLADHIPGAKLVVLNKVAHGFFWEQPEATIEAIVNFLNQETGE